MESHSQFDFAKSQLETAIQLYFEKNYYSAATLAGASEEIFGKFINKSRGTNQFEKLTDAMLSVGKLFDKDYKKNSVFKLHNDHRNWLKHYMEESTELEFDAEEVAVELIERAIENYRQITGLEIFIMREFTTSQIDPNNAQARKNDRCDRNK